VVEAVQSVAGVERTAIRLSPNGAVNGCDDPDHVGLFTAVAARLEALGVPWIELRQPGPHSSFRPTEQEPVSPHMRRVYAGRIVLNSDYKPATAETAVRSGEADAITFGRPFIANPDLVERIRRGAPLNRWYVDTFYSQGPAGYTDYPTLEEQAAA
jgi:2,4-dienoyl-CoA reductase-like NADH-dependent reductase (Old Yellow Enzyme family)